MLDSYTMKIATALSTTVQQDVIKITTEREWRKHPCCFIDAEAIFCHSTLVVNKIPLRAAEYCVFPQ